MSVPGSVTNRFPFNEGSGSTSADTVGGLTATLVATPTWATDLAPATGGYSLTFNGTSQYATFGTALDVVPAAGTLAFRFRANSASGGRILTKFNKDSRDVGGNEAFDFVLNNPATGSTTLRRFAGGVLSTLSPLGSLFVQGSTVAVTITWGPAGLRIYFNSVLVAHDGTYTGKLLADGTRNPMTAGAIMENGTPGAFCSCTVDDVLVASEQWGQERVSAYFRGLSLAVSGGIASRLVRQATAAFTPESGDGGAIQEPCVLWSSSLGLFQGWAHTGWASPNVIRYYESADGLTFARVAVTGSVTGVVVGGGQGGESSNNVGRFHVTKVGATFYGVYDDWDTNEVKQVTSADGKVWTNKAVIIANPGFLNAPSGVLVDDGGTCYLTTSRVVAGIWQTHLYSAPAITGPWTVANGGNPLTSLQFVSGGMYGGYCLKKISGRYWFFYHAAVKAGNNSTVTLAAYSSDLVNWTIYPYSPIAQLEGLTTGEDQTADSWVEEANGQTFYYANSVANGLNTSKTFVSVYAGAATQLVAQLGDRLAGISRVLIPGMNFGLGFD